MRNLLCCQICFLLPAEMLINDFSKKLIDLILFVVITNSQIEIMLLLTSSRSLESLVNFICAIAIHLRFASETSFARHILCFSISLFSSVREFLASSQDFKLLCGIRRKILIRHECRSRIWLCRSAQETRTQAVGRWRDKKCRR